MTKTNSPESRVLRPESVVRIFLARLRLVVIFIVAAFWHVIETRREEHAQ